MQCPRCSARDTRVIDSRLGKTGQSIRRRRQCTECNFRFNTIEEILRDDLIVIKRNQRREVVERAKMFNGIRRACEKRPIDLEQIDMLISDVLIELENEYDEEVPSKAIGALILQRLKTIDQIAYIRFASEWLNVKDIDELIEVAQDVKELASADLPGQGELFHSASSAKGAD